MKKKIIALLALVLTNSLYASWPMESVDKYNIVLVHGAADRWQGLDCVNGEGGESYAEAYSNKQGVVTDPSTCHRDSVEVPVPNAINPDSTRDSVFTECDTAYYNPKRIGGIIHGADTGSSATGMVKDLFPFLNEELLESPYAAYLQRPFVHPAGSPADNADEIGKSSWKGENMCSARRSLIEEAQEFKAKGSVRLDTLRRLSSSDEYRTIPSRNILVGHSMGGVAIREYVQGPNYNRDVDKIVTLDSPHEGTGALSALLDLSDYRHQLGDALSSSVVAAMSAAGIAMITVGKEPSILYPALITLSVSLRYEAFQQIIKEIAWNFYFKENGYDYRSDDLLAEYINPEKKNAGINNLKNRSVGADFPMARFLGAENSMTFTDPNASYREVLNTLIPEAFSVPISNVGYQIFGDGSATTRVVNAETGFVLGLAGINVQDNGSALIPTASGLAQNTSALGSGNVDIVRKTFDAAVHAETGDQNVFSDVFTAVGLSLIATDVAMSWCEACKIGAKIAIGTAGALYLSGGIVSSSYLGIQDLVESHDIPKNSKFHREHFGDKKTYSRVKGGSETVEPLLMEDFLYERPFVNLSLSVSDSALRAVEPGCYYEADSASKQQLCEVGLYDSLGNVVATTNGKMDYADFRKSPPLKFKSESDWSRMGLKLDRWERVNGLSPSGDSAKIPIRHVERYAVPDITVDNFIEKYSFVVDDLMPHRLRQIRLNFNYQEEIAWECDVTKDPSAGDACTVYKRSGGSGWDTLQLEKHPVQKDGRFDFEPRKYNYTILSALQKDNQNTVTISTVNKIGLS